MTNQVIPEAAVEAAAKAYFENCDYAEWEFIAERVQVAILADMRAALEAAAPYMSRTIASVEELDALPYGTVVLNDEGWNVTVAQRQAEDMRWYVTGCLEYIKPEALMPATVIYDVVYYEATK